MNYGALIRQAWAMTWHHRFLWVLGLFVGGGTGICSAGGQGPGVQYRADQREVEQFLPGAERFAAEATRWVTANLGLILALAMLAALLALVWFALWFIAQGGITQATVALAEGRPAAAGAAWEAGLRLVWRYIGLWLVLAAFALLFAAVIGAIIAGILVLGNLTEAPRMLLAVLAVLIGLPLLLAGLLLAIPVSIAVSYAQRAIVAEQAGPVVALQAGIRLVRARPLESLVVWIISLALGIGAGIAIIVALAVALIPLGAVGVGLWAAFGFTAPTLTYLAVAGLVVLALFLALGAISNTFLWSYWTLAYLQLRALAAPVPAG